VKPDLEPDVEYVGLMAEAWDALRGDTSGWQDRAFYLELILERGEPVLDVGCGTGRLLLDFLALGIDADGVDNSAEMLALLRRKAARLGLAPKITLQRMEQLDLARRYRTILVPSSSFQLLIEPEAARQALRRFHDHLEPGGTLVMPFIAMDRPYDLTSRVEAPLEDGTRVRRTGREVFDPATRLEWTDDLYEVLRDGVVVRSERHRREPATRAWREYEVAELYDQAGFIHLEWFANFTREPHQPGDEVFTIVARRP
jgi:cyclopropane fatty-acyl-phospholipid synthase-like methyltransferase